MSVSIYQRFAEDWLRITALQGLEWYQKLCSHTNRWGLGSDLPTALQYNILGWIDLIVVCCVT
jgi:hypothetical protein